MNCPDCQSKARLLHSKELYQKDYGWMWVCQRYPACDCYVGCHRGTTVALGELATKRTRKARIAVHQALDKLWKGGRMKRQQAYDALAEAMGITRRECHVSLFDTGMCEAALECLKTIKDKPKSYDRQGNYQDTLGPTTPWVIGSGYYQTADDSCPFEN